MTTKLDYIGALVSAYAGRGTTNVRSWQHMRDELEDAAPAFIRLARAVHAYTQVHKSRDDLGCRAMADALAELLKEVPDA